MKNHREERRKFKRYPVTTGLLFTDHDNVVGLAKIVDISSSGVKCCSLSRVACIVCSLENVELFGAKEDVVLTGLSGRMTRCSDDLNQRGTNAKICYYECGFEFFPQHSKQINRLQEGLFFYR